jgi:hypothetical protein
VRHEVRTYVHVHVHIYGVLPSLPLTPTPKPKIKIKLHVLHVAESAPYVNPMSIHAHVDPQYCTGPRGRLAPV